MSTGDSFAREGAMLGVPAIYLGSRDMPANNILIEKEMLFRKDQDEIVFFLEKLFNNEILLKSQKEIRHTLFQEWDDVTILILSLIKHLKKEI